MTSLLFFIRQLKPYRLMLIAGIALSLLLAISSIALLSLSGWFITAATFAGLSTITAATFNYFIPAASIRFLALLRILSRYADRVTNHDTTFKILANLRVWFYKKLIPLSPTHLISQRSGNLLNRITHDIDTLDHLYLNVLSPLIITVLITTVITIFIAYYSIILSTIMLAMIIVTLIFVSLITFIFGIKIGRNNQDATARLRTKIIDSIQGFVDLLLFSSYKDRTHLLSKEQIMLTGAQQRFSILKGFAIGATHLLSGITLYLILLLAIPLVYHNQLSAAQFAMIIFLIMVIFEQLLVVPMAALHFGKTQRAAQQLLAITNQKPAVFFPEKSVVTITVAPKIVFKNVSFTYPNCIAPVIKNLNLTIDSGTQFGITGPSGSGKTTLAYLLTRIWNPDMGDIFLNQNSIRDFSEKNLRHTICLVTQHCHIFNASIRDNLTLMQNNISDEKCFYVLEKMDLADMVRKLPDGINTLMGEFGKNFSGGQIRRISIARALLTNASIMIFDEPTTGLESTLVEKIWKNCESDFKNKTIVIITHDDYLLRQLDGVWTPDSQGTS